MPRAAETADKDLPLAVLLLPPRPSPGDAGFLSRGPLAASGTALTCSWSEAGVRSSSRCLSPAAYQRSHLSSISYHPSSPVAQSLIRSWDFQAPPLIPLPCIDNPASPLHTRTLAHALQPNGLGLLFFAQHHCRNSSSSRTRQDPGVCLLTASPPPPPGFLPLFLSKHTTSGHDTRRHNHEQTSDLDVSVQCPPALGPGPWRRRGRRRPRPHGL